MKKIKVTSSSKISKTIHHDGGDLSLFGKKKTQTFEILRE